jgi:ferredoxin-NADP reductase
MPPTNWQPAIIVDIRPETPTAKTFRLRLNHPSTHLPGQHYIVKLADPFGYSASRSYSVASAPAPDGSTDIDLTIERLPGGEVSTFLHDQAAVSDELDVRGPIGGWFVWAADRLALLIGGGSGVVPLMAMLRYTRTAGVGERRPPGRTTPSDLQLLLLAYATIDICGSSPFADAATDAATSIGVPVERVRVERFGPSG